MFALLMSFDNHLTQIYFFLLSLLKFSVFFFFLEWIVTTCKRNHVVSDTGSNIDAVVLLVTDMSDNHYLIPE